VRGLRQIEFGKGLEYSAILLDHQQGEQSSAMNNCKRHKKTFKKGERAHNVL